MANDQVCRKGLNSTLGEKYPLVCWTSEKLLNPKNAAKPVSLFVELNQDDGINKVEAIMVTIRHTTSAGSILTILLL